MIRRKVSLLLAILMVITTMTVGFTPTAAGSDNGITTDISAPYDEYEEIRKLKQKDQTDPDNNEPQQIGRESLYTKTIDNGDGTKTLEVYGTPVKYRTEDGSVNDISLKPVAKGKGFTTGDHRLSISFPEKADSGISLDTGKYVITVTPVTENGTAVKTASAYLSDSDAIVYRCDPKTSYEYNITYSGYKENIVVSEYTGQTDFLFRLETDGLKLSASSEGSHGSNLVLSNDEGKVVANIGDIIVFTSDNRNNTLGSIWFETVNEGEEYIIRINVPEAYLSDPATHYPIYIDPTLSVEEEEVTVGTIEDITVNQNASADSPSHVTLYAGKGSNTYGAMRAVMRFPELDLDGIVPSNITSATLKMRDVMCYSNVLQIDCYGYGGTLPTGSFTTSNMTWSGINSEVQYYESSGRYRSSHYVSYNNGLSTSFWYSYNILPIVREWAQGTNSGTLAQKDQAVVFKSTDSHEQGSVSQYVCFGSYDVTGSYKPLLSITYVSVDSIDIQADSNKLLIGRFEFLDAITSPAGLSVNWYSSNDYIATVTQSGLVTGISTGVVTITARCGDVFDTYTIAVVPLEDGVYTIQNSSFSPSILDGYLIDETDSLVLDSRSYERNDLWLLKNVPGTNSYTLNPLSRTTVNWSGTDYGLFGGYEMYDTSVSVDIISNVNTIISYGQWIISGTPSAGYRIFSCSGCEYDILVSNSSGTGVELEYEENLVNTDDPIDIWIFTEWSSETTEVSGITLSDSFLVLEMGTLNCYEDLKSFVTVEGEISGKEIPDCRVSFSKYGNSVGLSLTGIVTALHPGITKVTITLTGFSDEIRISVHGTAQPGPISLTHNRFHIWVGDYYDTPAEKSLKFIWSVIKENNGFSVAFKHYLYNSQMQSVVFDECALKQYHMYFDFVDSDNNNQKLYINYNSQTGNVAYSSSSANATIWQIEYYGAEDQGSSHEIVIYTTDNNVRKYLSIVSYTQSYADISISPYKQNGVGEIPFLYATPCSLNNADISLLGVSWQGSSDFELYMRAHGWLDIIEPIQMLEDPVYDCSFMKTLYAYCGDLDEGKVFDALQNSRFVILRGHGEPGVLYLDESCSSNNSIIANEIFTHPNTFEEAEVIIFGSCYSGSGSGYSNLVNCANYKGAETVIGFSNQLNRKVFSVFQYEFFDEYLKYANQESEYSTLKAVVEVAYEKAYKYVVKRSDALTNDNTPIPNITYVMPGVNGGD